ncbi:MAG: Gfo/Idh/MocA family oxidoreductase [Pirellulaceae bacterium]
MAGKITRRNALKTSSALLTGYWLGTSARGARGQSANGKLNVACIGVGGRGGANVGGVSGENIVALCDVDEKRAGSRFERFPKARKYHDFRKMFDDMEKKIDAVVVSTPDHTHFHPSMMALERGKHLYCEKPMAHNVWESRRMTDLAREKGVATQLGVQRHTIGNIHRVVELIKAKAIGEVKEVHSWQGGSRGMPSDPTEFPPVPPHLDWDLWLGPAEYRDYSPAYCPYNWRFWWDFGTAEAGNWGCHILDIPFWALDLKYPTSVEGSGPEVHPEKTPKSMRAVFQFPGNGDRGPVKLTWSHGKHSVPSEWGLDLGGANNVFVGTEGMLVCGFGKRKLYPEDEFANYQKPEETIPDSPGFHKEWILAAKGETDVAPTCNFNYSGPLAETVLLGNVAYRSQSRFEWDAENLVAKGGSDKIPGLIRETYRKGWKVS